MKESELIPSFLRHDLSRLIELEFSSTSERDIKYARALRRCLELEVLDDGYKVYEEAKKLVFAALDGLNHDTEVLAILRAYSALFSLQDDGRPTRRNFQFAEGLSLEKMSSDLKAFLCHLEWRCHFFYRDYEKQLTVLEDGLSDLISGTSSWLLLKANRIEASLVRKHLKQAEEDLSELQNFRHIYPFQGLAPYEYFLAWFLHDQGEFERAFSVLESIPPERRQTFLGIFLKLKVQILWKQKRFEEANVVLQDLQPLIVNITPGLRFTRRFITLLDWENLKGSEAFLKKDFDRARSHIREVMQLASRGPVVGNKRQGQGLLTQIELAAGHPRAARLILQMGDPQGRGQPVEWARVCMLEGNYEEAIEYLMRAFSVFGWGYVRERLSTAYEISGSNLAEIMGRVWVKLSESSPKEKSKTIAQEVSEPVAEFPFIGNSQKIQEIRQHIAKMASAKTTVLISGETGSGKEVVARLLHEMSPHASKPFIPINCAAMADSLIESELFGYAKGAFTGATTSREGLFLSAGDGTIFLDEISSTSNHFQSALLRVLENQEVRAIGSNRSYKIKARIVAATNESLEKAIEEKKFRADLYYRLSRFAIQIPALRERREDIALLVHYYLKKFLGKLQFQIEPQLMAKLVSYDWPGNVRELRNEMERIAYFMGEREVLTADLFDKDGKPDQAFRETPTPIQPNLRERFEAVPSNDSEGGNYRMRRHQKILDLLKRRSKITRLEIIHELKCSPNTATLDLRLLEEQKLIKRIQPNALSNSTYFVVGDVASS
jgi:DNA-binding NtrC family response regulator